MESIKTMVDVNTILGDPVETPDGTVIVPVSRVSLGFAAGGTEYDPQGKEDGHGTYPVQSRGVLAVRAAATRRSVSSTTFGSSIGVPGS